MTFSNCNNKKHRMLIKEDPFIRYPTYQLILENADSITLEEFRAMGTKIPRFAEGLFDEPEIPGTRRKRRKLATFTDEEKLARRKLKNRVAAQSARDRKRKLNMEQCSELEKAREEIEKLKSENCTLRAENHCLRKENIQLREMNMNSSHSPRFHENQISSGNISPKNSQNKSNNTRYPIIKSEPLKFTEEPNNKRQRIDRVSNLDQYSNQTSFKICQSVPPKQTLTSAVRPQSSAGIGTSQIHAERRLNRNCAKRKNSMSMSVIQKLNVQDQNVLIRILITLILSVISKKTDSLIVRLSSTPEKSVNRRIKYAFSMKRGQHQRNLTTMSGLINTIMPNLLDAATTHNFYHAIPKVTPEQAQKIQSTDTKTMPEWMQDNKNRMNLCKNLSNQSTVYKRKRKISIMQPITEQKVVTRTFQNCYKLQSQSPIVSNPPSPSSSVESMEIISNLIETGPYEQGLTGARRAEHLMNHSILNGLNNTMTALFATKNLTQILLKEYYQKLSQPCPIHTGDKSIHFCLICRQPLDKKLQMDSQPLKREYLETLNVADSLLKCLYQMKTKDMERRRRDVRQARRASRIAAADIVQSNLERTGPTINIHQQSPYYNIPTLPARISLTQMIEQTLPCQNVNLEEMRRHVAED